MSQIEENSYAMDVEEEITLEPAPALHFVYMAPLRETRLPFLEPDLVPNPVRGLRQRMGGVRRLEQRIHITPFQNRFLEPNLVPTEQIPIQIPENNINIHNLINRIHEIPDLRLGA